MNRFRWVVGLAAIILLILAFRKGVLEAALVAFVVGAAGGFIQDAIATKFRWWVYTRTPFMSPLYFLITLPAWGTLGTVVVGSFWWLHKFPFLPGWSIPMIVTTALLIAYEGINLKTKSWRYYAPAWVVVAGWFPLVLGFRITYTLVH